MAKVKKIINDPENIVDEVLDGLVAISQGLSPVIPVRALCAGQS